jgi:recombination associated protein RdgC
VERGLGRPRAVSALKGSLTYARFFVDGELPDGFHDRFLKAIRKNVLQPLVPEEDAPERSGWCRIGEPFDLELEHDDVFFNEFLNLGFRTDRWAVPGPLLRAKVREAETEALGRKGRERLSRGEKKELKDMVTKRLRREVPPRTRAVDVSWALNDGIVRFFTQAPAPAGLMADLFTRTFKLKLVPEAPYTLAARLGLGKAQEAAWIAAEPTDLSEGVA